MERLSPAVPPVDAQRRSAWTRVHDVVGPLLDAPAPLGLHVHGAVADGEQRTRTGPRAGLVVPPRTTADFGTYFSAFPAAQWRRHAGAESVRLQVAVDASAVLTVHRSDRAGRSSVVEQRLLRAAVEETVDVAVPDGSALVWFGLQAGAEPVRLLDAGWAVDAPPLAGGVVVGTPTTGRTADVVRNLRRLLDAPAVAEALERCVVVDHAAEPVEPAVRAAFPDDERVVVRRQANLGGSGGYSRVMHEALGTPGAELVLLLDDDVVVEPAAVLRAIEFARRARGSEIVGLQMLDAERPSVLEAGAEVVAGGAFWWTATDPQLPGLDVAAAPVAELPALHRMEEAHFAAWWAALVPLRVVRTIGYAMPLFLKWDDAEYGLRAGRAGFGTVSLQGAAVWHESWRGKDDARTWPAFYHSRNRLVAALLHGAPSVRTRLLLSSLALEVKQLLALQAFAVERRQEGVRAVLAGPEPLGAGHPDDLLRLLALSTAAPDQQRLPHGEVDERVSAAAPRPLAPVLAPRGAGLAVWAGLVLLRHLFAPVRGDAARLPAGRGTWWVLPSFDDVFTPTADGRAYYRLQRDRLRFRRLLASAFRLHLRLWLRWPGLRQRYRAAADDLASPGSWERRFTAAG